MLKSIVSTLLGITAWYIARWSVELNDWGYIGALVLFWIALGLFSATERVRLNE